METVMEQHKLINTEVAEDDGSQAMDKSISFKFLLKFAMPTMISMVVMGIMGTIDGIFVSRLIGPEALASVGIVWPFLTFAMSVGFMLGTGGNALVAKKIGEKKITEARSNFTLIIFTAFLASVILSAIGLLFPSRLLSILGADSSIYGLARDYMVPLLWLLPPVILGVVFQSYLMTEGKAHIGMVASIIGAVLNIFLNWLLISRLEMGLTGAALATGLNYLVPAVVGFVFFMVNKNGTLYFVKPKFEFPVLFQASTNGVSEMITMGASSITMTLMNNTLMDLEGPMAVASAGVIWAGVGLLMNIFIGYTSGIAPVISFNFGKEDTVRLKGIYQKSLVIIFVMACIAAFLGLFVMTPLLWVYDIPSFIPVYDMARTGFNFSLIAFFFIGFNAFSSSMFTALNNGLVSGILSVFRTFVFVIASLLILPQFFGLNGVWMSTPVAELLALTMSIYFFKKMKGRYQYA